MENGTRGHLRETGRQSDVERQGEVMTVDARRWIGEFFESANFTQALPARIAADIARQQFKSEIMVGIVQLAVVAVFFVLYFATPASFTPDAPVRATPLGLS